ncbi:hypothetical protein SLA2020_452650 [Shorea laevis]
MYRGFSRRLLEIRRQLHTLSGDGPSQSLRRKIAELERARKARKSPEKDQLFVEVPESKAFLDTASMPMILTVVGVALFTKLLFMYDESKSQEIIERKIQNAPEGQGTVRMLTREEWEEIREVRPRTPFESKLARPNAQIRTDEPLRLVRHFLLVNPLYYFCQYICAQIFVLHSLAFTFTSLLLGYSLHIISQVIDESAEC